MTYARARLWLGISGVGSLVSLAAMALTVELPHEVFEVNPGFQFSDFLQLAGFNTLLLLWLTPLDFLGGFWLPRKFNKSSQSLADWLRGYVTLALLQTMMFVCFGTIIIMTSQILRTGGVLILTSLFAVTCLLLRDRVILGREVKAQHSSEKLLDAIAMIQSWQIFVPRTVAVEHRDVGFTGGVIGFGKSVTIVIPRAWLSFSTENLATAIARRALAVSTGSYRRGLLFAFFFNVIGFFFCSLIPGAGFASVAELVTTICGFTLWSFLGLLFLPTLSRRASLKIDKEIVQRGLPKQWITTTASALDQLQDDEPKRSRIIEAIFHPVPSVESRSRQTPVLGFSAWNVTRTTLFLSWACLGLLSRSVHCNVGRPELWMLLPTD